MYYLITDNLQCNHSHLAVYLSFAIEINLTKNKYYLYWFTTNKLDNLSIYVN